MYLGGGGGGAETRFHAKHGHGGCGRGFPGGLLGEVLIKRMQIAYSETISFKQIKYVFVFHKCIFNRQCRWYHRQLFFFLVGGGGSNDKYFKHFSTTSTIFRSLSIFVLIC